MYHRSHVHCTTSRVQLSRVLSCYFYFYKIPLRSSPNPGQTWVSTRCFTKACLKLLDETTNDFFGLNFRPRHRPVDYIRRLLYPGGLPLHSGQAQQCPLAKLVSSVPSGAERLIIAKAREREEGRSQSRACPPFVVVVVLFIKKTRVVVGR